MADFFSCNGGKLETSEGYTLFRRFPCVRIRIVLLARDVCLCPIYHWLSISRQWIYYSRFALVIYPLHDWPPTSNMLGNKSHCKQDSCFWWADREILRRRTRKELIFSYQWAIDNSRVRKIISTVTLYRMEIQVYCDFFYRTISKRTSTEENV